MKSEDNDNFEMEEDRISLEATGWIAKRDEGFSAEDQDAFFEWLASDPRHKAMFNKRVGLWEEMNLLTDWRPEHSRKPNPDLLAVKKKSFSGAHWVLAVTALAAVLALSVFLPDWGASSTADTRMLAFGGAQDYESHVLDDGSLVELNQGAQVSVQYSKQQRLIFLHTGEAYFTVEKDASRPFLVLAGEAQVRATGTAFNVSLSDDGVEVIVTEGRVVVNPSLIEHEEMNLGQEDQNSRELIAGQRSVMTSMDMIADAQIEAVSMEEIDRRLAWKGEVFDFTDVPLSEVIYEFNRRNRTQILIADYGLNNLKITAKLRSSNLDLFIELLDITMGIEARRDENSNIVLRKNGI